MVRWKGWDSQLESRPNVATGIDWAFAPDWLTIEEACFLTGHDRLTMYCIIGEDRVGLNTEGQIEKRGLWECQEVTVELAHWENYVARIGKRPGVGRGFFYPFLSGRWEWMGVANIRGTW